MTAIAPDDARRFVRAQLEEIAVTRRPGESIKAMLGRIARVSGLDFNRTRKLWYGECETIPWHEAETLRLKAQEQRQLWRDMTRRREILDARAETQRIRDHAAHLRRRATDNRLPPLEGDEAERQGRFVFWLGAQDTGLD